MKRSDSSEEQDVRSMRQALQETLAVVCHVLLQLLTHMTLNSWIHQAVVANHQTKGQGTRGRVWVSQPYKNCTNAQYNY